MQSFNYNTIMICSPVIRTVNVIFRKKISFIFYLKCIQKLPNKLTTANKHAFIEKSTQ